MNRFAKIFTALLTVERIHSLAKLQSSRYRHWVDRHTKEVRKRLCLTSTAQDRILAHLKISDYFSEYSCHSLIYDRFQHETVNALLYEKINIESVLTFEKSNEIELNWLRCLDVEPLNIYEGKRISDFTYEVPASIKDRILRAIRDAKFSLGSEEGPGYTNTTAIQSSELILGSIRGIPLAFKTRGTGSLLLEVCYNKKDELIVDSLIKEMCIILEARNDLQGLVAELRYMPVMHIESGGAVKTSSSSEFSFSVDFPQIEELRGPNRTYDLNVYDTEIRNVLEKDILGFIKKTDWFTGSARRSYLFEGPPGTGKSSILRDMIKMVPENYNIFSFSKSVIKDLGRFATVHKPLFPALILIEDVDLLINDNETKQDLLNFLDGTFSPRQMIVAMTTNNLQDISDAIKYRPGRVDRIVHVAPGSHVARAAQLKSLLGKTISSMPIEEMVDRTSGATVAELQEMVRRGIIYTDDFDGTISYEAIDLVLQECFKEKPLQLSKETVDEIVRANIQ